MLPNAAGLPCGHGRQERKDKGTLDIERVTANPEIGELLTGKEKNHDGDRRKDNWREHDEGSMA